MNRGSKYKVIERRKEKTAKKRNWNKKGGYGAPIIVPATPGGELAKMLREIAEQEPDRKKRFKIVERGGRTIERSLMKPNPLGKEGCEKTDCILCKQPGGGKLCHKGNVCYIMDCKIDGCDAVYDGESHRNAYTRGREHMQKYERKDESSFIYKHQVEQHNSQPANFGMRVARSFKDPLSRQVTEAIMIKNHKGTLLNSKAEFHQAPLVRVRQEIVRGLDE